MHRSVCMVAQMICTTQTDLLLCFFVLHVIFVFVILLISYFSFKSKILVRMVSVTDH